MDQKKRKRMDSNRESARRLRIRKQKHLDNLNSQAAQLRKENKQILERVDVAAQHFRSVEAENSVLRAQMTELSQRLESLNEILGYICCCTSTTDLAPDPEGLGASFGSGDGFINIDPFGLAYASQPIV